MPLVTSDCFLSLTTSERWEQIYLALGGTSECFPEATVFEQQRLILGVLGSEECIYTTEDFWRAWAAFLGIECVESVMDAQRQIYGEYGGDETCFYGLGPDGQIKALFLVTRVPYSISFEPAVLNLGPGESGEILVTLTLIRGESQMATLTVPDLPPGWTGEFSDNPISTGGGTSILTITAP